MPRSRAGKAMTIVLLNFLGLLLIECAMRVLWTVRADLTAADRSSAARPQDPVWFVDSPTLGWERRPGFSGGREVRREFDDAGYQAIDSRQLADTSRARKRVLFVGDSNTMGYSVAASDTFAEVVEARLLNVEAINLGVIGYSSYQGRKVLEQRLPELKPDAVVVSFNFNDRRSVAEPRDADGPGRFQQLAAPRANVPRRIVDKLEWSYTVRALSGGLRRTGAIEPAPPRVPSEVRLDSLVLRANEDAYRENLRWMAVRAREEGAKVVFLLLGDNPVQTHDLMRGIERLEAGDYKLAIDHLRFASARFGLRTLGNLYLARAYAAVGDATRADEALRYAPGGTHAHGQEPARLDSEYHAIMRAVAAEQNVGLVDGVAVLNAHPEDFEDMCHFDADGHRRIGEEVAKHLAQIFAAAEFR